MRKNINIWENGKLTNYSINETPSTVDIHKYDLSGYDSLGIGDWLLVIALFLITLILINLPYNGARWVKEISDLFKNIFN